MVIGGILDRQVGRLRVMGVVDLNNRGPRRTNPETVGDVTLSILPFVAGTRCGFNDFFAGGGFGLNVFAAAGMIFREAAAIFFSTKAHWS